MHSRIAVTEWRQFFLGLAVCATASIWGLSVLIGSLQGSYAQEAAESTPAEPPAVAPASSEEQALPNGVYRFAFVDMERVIRAYPRWWKSFGQIQDRASGIRSELEEERRELQLMRSQLEETPDPTDDLLSNYARRVHLLEQNARAYEGQIENEMRNLSKGVYDDVYNVIEALAADRFDVVLGVAEREIRTGSQAEFFQKIPARAVVIHPTENDLTQQAIVKMEVHALFDDDFLAAAQTTRQQLLADINRQRERTQKPTLQDELEQLGMTEELERVRAIG